MYSVVLMAALTSGGDVPALGHGCCGGGYGCWGGCYGCYGGCHGGHRKHGCCGGGYGCWGGGHGCHGGCHGGHRKHGCCGCYGGGYGYSCYGGCYGGFGGGMGCYGGGYGGFGAGMGVGAPGMVVPSVTPAAPIQTAPAPAQKKTTSLEGAAPATLVVTVPAEARLTIDGEATTSTATQRVFVSPALNFGRDYSYTLQAEFKKNGKPVTMSKEVTVKAGEEIRVSFDDDATAEIVSR